MRSSHRVLIDPDGHVEVVDPGFDDMALLEAVGGPFEIPTAPLEGFRGPRFQAARRLPGGAGLGGGSLLDAKRRCSRQLLEQCRLCAWNCGINRVRGERGTCGLGPEAIVAGHYVHVAEEPLINPSLVIELAGCALRCRYCQQGRLLDVKRVRGQPLDASLWSRLQPSGARSLSFLGGNPDESMPAILDFLAAAPPDWSLPVVWNCHAYSSSDGLDLLQGIVDVYVPDLKYGNDACAFSLSRIPGYTAIARAAVARMAAQDALVIVRVLVLPGHVECCHLPTLQWLAELDCGGDRLSVSVMGQYRPDWRIAARDGQMRRKPLPEEVGLVRDSAVALGLRLAR